MASHVTPDPSLRARFLVLAGACAAFAYGLGQFLAAFTIVTHGIGLHAVLGFVIIAAIALYGLSASHPFGEIGYANWVTTFRASLVAIVAALIVEPQTTSTAWIGVVVASLAASLDGWDGWLARRSRMESAFGARFDMEIDALLILLLSVLVWRYDKAGWWIVLSGALRYLFVAAGWILPWLNDPLPPSMRRKTVCVIQIVCLIVAIGPIVPRPMSTLVSAASLAILIWSFAVDVRWLRGHERH